MFGRSFDTHCTIDVEHSNEALSAHVELDDGYAVGPGDRVRVHGAPIRVAFGERLRERRTATVHQAGAIERAWTKLAARFELAELYEVSFTTRRRL